MATLSALSSPSWRNPNPNPSPNPNPNNPNNLNFDLLSLDGVGVDPSRNLPPPAGDEEDETCSSVASSSSPPNPSSDPSLNLDFLRLEGSSQMHRAPDEADSDEEDRSSSSAASSSDLQKPIHSPNTNLRRPAVHPPPPPPPPSRVPSLYHVSFNQDHGCFSVGTDRGFRIYNCDPFRELFRRDFDGGGGVGGGGGGGGIGAVEMLFRCNILALVGGGPEPQYPVNKVMIWDDHQSRCIGELSFRSEVRAVRLRRDRIVAVLEQKIFVYNFSDLKLVHQIETIANPRGLCAVSQAPGSMVLVCPGLQKGQVRVEHYASRRTKFIMAHDSRIACFSLTQDGQLLATASTKGTLVRIFNTVDGTLLQEVRRGADRAEIYSLAFSSTAQWLAVSSDKGTMHVFNLKVNSVSLANDKLRMASDPSHSVSSSSSLSIIKGVLPKYFSSEWSVAQFHLIEGSQYIVAFGHEKNTVVILGIDGSFYRCGFDPVNGGEMTQLEYHNFLKPDENF